MTVTAYALGGMAPARATALGATIRPNWLAVPFVTVPCVGLYSDALNQWSPLYVDDGLITSVAWASDPLAAADAADTNATTLRSKAIAALAVNATFLALVNPTTNQAVAQVQSLTRQVNALIRLAVNQLDSTTGT